YIRRMPITVGATTPATYTFKETRRVMAGYAFGHHQIRWKSPLPTPLVPTLPPAAYRWACRSYDCVPADSGPITQHDLSATAGLNSRIGAKVLLGMWSVAGDVSDALYEYRPGDTSSWSSHTG